MGFDPRRWQPSSGGPPITANVEALLAENDALRREVRSLRLQLELLLANGRRAASEPRSEPAGRRPPSPRREAAGERVSRSVSHGLSVELVARWSAAMARHPRWQALPLGPPGGLRGLIEQLRGRSWNPALSLEEELDRRSPGLGAELAAALRGPHSRGRLAVRAAFALYGPRAIEWLSEEPLRVVEELHRRTETLEPGPKGARRRGTRTENHTQTGRSESSSQADAGADAGGHRRTATGGREARAGAAGGSRSAAGSARGGGDPGSETGSGKSHRRGRPQGDGPDPRRSAGGSGRQGARSTTGAGGRSDRDPGHAHASRDPAGPADPRARALALLGLESGASLQAIKRAYRRLAKAHHPDLGGDVQAFHRLDAAYRSLL